MALDREPPEPKVPGGAQATFKQGSPTKVEVPVRHLVDDWFNTEFTFDVSDGVASLRSADPQQDSYHFSQNEQARQKAYEVVENLPFINEVERIND